jgi:hypothetical protein
MKQSHLLLLIAAVLCVGYALWQGIDVRAKTQTVLPLDAPSPTPTAIFPSSDGGARFALTDTYAHRDTAFTYGRGSAPLCGGTGSHSH